MTKPVMTVENLTGWLDAAASFGPLQPDLRSFADGSSKQVARTHLSWAICAQAAANAADVYQANIDAVLYAKRGTVGGKYLATEEVERRHKLRTDVMFKWFVRDAPTRRSHQPYEVMVDFFATTLASRHDAVAVPFFAAESETCQDHLVTDGLKATFGGYEWDFYKLLLTRAKVKLFIAVVGKGEGGSPAARTARLQKNLAAMATAPVASAGIGPDAVQDLGIILFTLGETLQDTTASLWTSRGAGTWYPESAWQPFHATAPSSTE